MKTVIIGGVAGGAAAAARLRRLDEKAQIVVLERSGYVSYANCGLPYYIGDVILQKENLTLQTPQSFQSRFDIDVRVKHEVISIDPKNKSVLVKNLADGTQYTETYDNLILSPGAKSVVPPLPGIDTPQIFTLRTVEDTMHIKQYVSDTAPKSAVVVGGGFIGLEMAENLLGLGIDTTLVERDRQVLPPLDYDMACSVHSYLQEQGLKLALGTQVSGFSYLDGSTTVLLQDKSPLQAQLVILAVGVAPDSTLAKMAGLTLGVRDSIVVDEHMRTSAPNIYAVGDAVQIKNKVSGALGLVSLAGPAAKQGRIAADNICGISRTYQGALGSSVIKLFDMSVATTGLSEKQAVAQGVAYDRVITFSPNHATYYPGASNMTLKVLFAPDSGRILGAQIVGFDGVDKRCDVLATAIFGGMSAEDLCHVDLCYAPPFSSAKDPVNMAGFVIQNLLEGQVSQFHWSDVNALVGRQDITLLDVRTPAEFKTGHFPGAINIPVDSLRENLHQLDPQKHIYVNCHSGLRSYIACRILSGNDFACSNLSGGYRFYATVDTKDFDPSPTHPCGIQIK